MKEKIKNFFKKTWRLSKDLSKEAWSDFVDALTDMSDFASDHPLVSCIICWVFLQGLLFVIFALVARKIGLEWGFVPREGEQ